MSDIIRNYLPWLLSAITIYMTLLAGNKTSWAWSVGLVNQGLWLVWIIITATWGLLPMNVALWVVYTRNHLRWTRAALPIPVDPGVTEASRDVLAERERQKSVEGWTAEHDDEHLTGQMASAAACYASPDDFPTKTVPFDWSDASRYMDAQSEPTGKVVVPNAWPWDGAWWKPSLDQRRNLVKAGALILAEIERLDRLKAGRRA